MKETLTDTNLDDRIAEAFGEWAADGELSPELARSLRASLRRNTGTRRLHAALKWSAIAAPAVALMLVAALALSPVTAAWAQQLPLVGGLVGRLAGMRSGWTLAEANGFLQDVGAEVTANGYTFRVDSVIADPAETTVFWSITGDHPKAPDFGVGEGVLFNGEQFVTHTETATDYLAGAAIGDDSGNVVAGTFSCDALPVLSGTLDVTLTKIGDVTGSWHLSFAVDRSRATGLTTTLTSGQQIPCAGGTLRVDRVVLAPTQTVVDVSWTGPSVADGDYPCCPRLTFGQVAMLGADGAKVRPRQMSGGPAVETSAGLWQSHWTLSFDRVDPLPETLTIGFGGEVYVAEETRVPLREGQAITAADGRSLAVTAITGSAREGGATIEYRAPDQPTLPYEDWQVRDQSGLLHKITDGSGEEIDGNARLVEHWQLEPGSEAVELVSAGYWRATEFARIQIDTHR